MEMIAIAVHARSFLKELEESTSGREPARAAMQADPSPRGSLRDLARAAGAVGAVAVLATFLSLVSR